MLQWQSRTSHHYLAAWFVEDPSCETIAIINFPISVFQQKDQPDLFDVVVSGGRMNEEVGNYLSKGVVGLDNAKAIAISYAKQEVMRRTQEALALLSAL